MRHTTNKRHIRARSLRRPGAVSRVRIHREVTVPVGVVNAPDTVALSCTVEPIAADKIAAAPAASFAPAPAWMSVTVDDVSLLGVNGSHKPSDAR